jgi:hypothetical protein
MAEPARHFEQPHDRNARLHALGLDEATVEQIVMHGLLARQACSPLAPPSFPGTTQWAETVVGSRVILIPRDWTPSDAHNFSRILNPEETIAIVVATGDDYTGIATGEPRTRYPKGPETTAAVNANLQMAFPGLAIAEFDKATPSGIETWILLLLTNDFECRYELSRPQAQDKEGRVIAWLDRIIFPPIEIEGLPGRDDDGGDNGDDGDEGGLVVPVERI